MREAKRVEFQKIFVTEGKAFSVAAGTGIVDLL